jgi:EthD domain
MIKIVALIKRRADVSHEEFSDYYEHRHAPLFHRTIPPEVAGAITHYVQNHALQLGSGATEPAYDCVTEIGFADLAGLRVWSDWYLGEGGKVLRDDEERFMDPRRRVVIVTDERDLGIGR